MRTKKAGLMIIAAFILIFLLIFIICGLYNALSVTEITLSTGCKGLPVKLALITDLHSSSYGEGQAELISAIDGQEPDLVCLVGDIFDCKRPDDNAEAFIAAISGKYPCYYVTGNHELRSGSAAFGQKMDILEKYGVIRLSGESRELEINGRKITLCGVDDPETELYESGYDISDALYAVRKALPKDSYSILLSHRPEYFSHYADYGFDLTLCGHAHGGQWRIPRFLENGLIAPGQGLFPEYTNGLYTLGDSSMIVSRGLAKRSVPVPRFYNRPEIVIVELQ